MQNRGMQVIHNKQKVGHFLVAPGLHTSLLRPGIFHATISYLCVKVHNEKYKNAIER